MIISKKRIRNLDNYISNYDDRNIVIIKEIDSTITDIGFSQSFDNGEKVLPKAKGPISRFNANGKEVIRKDLPKETCYRQIMWSWKQYEGRGSTVERTELREIPYLRYPRDFIPAPSCELKIATRTDNTKLICSEEIQCSAGNKDKILHIINLFLELFGFCEIVDENLDSLITTNIHSLNWNVLPQGNYPWSRLSPLVMTVVGNRNGRNAAVIEKRFEHINGKSPDFVAVGNGGFFGYVIFGFTAKGLYVLESVATNNATYILSDNWQVISSLTKAEILNNSLHTARVIHRSDWFTQMDQLLR